MIKEIRVKNYKSIHKLKMEPGRVTVLIGENGSGKSNILEAVALGSAAASNKLDNEFLAPRGIRVTEPRFMRSAFEKENMDQDIYLYFEGDDDAVLDFELHNDNKPYSKWDLTISNQRLDNALKIFISADQELQKTEESLKEWSQMQKEVENLSKTLDDEKVRNLQKRVSEQISLGKENKQKIEQFVSKRVDKEFFKIIDKLNLSQFLIYSPENSYLRVLEQEGRIEPLGIKGEGLFKLLKVLSLDENIEKLKTIKEKLKIISWFQDFDIPNGMLSMERFIRIKDKYLDDDVVYFDQKSSNEGFLLLLFYFALFVSGDTPKFFAIDNIDASLNPKLCARLVRELAELAKKNDKQVILTTHNPAILDGLNLDDPEQKLFVVFRNALGHTKTEQVFKAKPLEGEEPVKMSEAFLRGYIGGLPDGF